MIMFVDLEAMTIDFSNLKKRLEDFAAEISVTIKIQHEDIFKSMHEI